MVSSYTLFIIKLFAVVYQLIIDFSYGCVTWRIHQEIEINKKEEEDKLDDG